MGEFLKGECPHCRQPIEYPSEGTGQTVPCPTCRKPFVLMPVQPPVPELVASPKPRATDSPAPVVPKPTEAPRTGDDKFDRACREFAADREFAPRAPTREQLARAWALAKFRKRNPFESPTHAELVAA